MSEVVHYCGICHRIIYVEQTNEFDVDDDNITENTILDVEEICPDCENTFDGRYYN